MFREISRRWLDPGQILGLIMLRGSIRAVHFFRVWATEYKPFTFAFNGGAVIAAAAGSGWVEPLTVNNDVILQPPYTWQINHLFFGITPSTALLYLQYPMGSQKNSLVGTPLNTNEIAAQTGRLNSWDYPSLETELITVNEIRPALQVYNPSGAAQIITIKIHAMQYGHEPIAPTVEEMRRARVISCYGVDPVNAPGWLERSVPDVVKDVSELSQYRAQGRAAAVPVPLWTQVR